jgi:hypothetical protein
MVDEEKAIELERERERESKHRQKNGRTDESQGKKKS